MPTYEYECQGCQQRVEYYQSIKDPPKTVCEACGGALERVISPAGFILKGGGWYKDLYSSSKGASPSSTKTDTPAKAEAATPAKAESPKTTGKAGE